LGFGALGEAAAREILEHLGPRATGALVVDLGCGAGATAGPLASAGCCVLGVDLSPRMLERARHRAPSARFLLGSVFEVPLPRCQVICAVGEVLNYLADRTNDATALLAFFRRAFSALDQIGLLKFQPVVAKH
jgi:SAM-dependent methyltransferase